MGQPKTALQLLCIPRTRHTCVSNLRLDNFEETEDLQKKTSMIISRGNSGTSIKNVCLIIGENDNSCTHLVGETSPGHTRLHFAPSYGNVNCKVFLRRLVQLIPPMSARKKFAFVCCASTSIVDFPLKYSPGVCVIRPGVLDPAIFIYFPPVLLFPLPARSHLFCFSRFCK